jgi:hypothetical protein
LAPRRTGLLTAATWQPGVTALRSGQMEYGSLVDEVGLEYLTYQLHEITAFYQRAAEAGWATVFIADQ